MCEALASTLTELRQQTPYNKDEDFVFASPTLNGKQPLWGGADYECSICQTCKALDAQRLYLYVGVHGDAGIGVLYQCLPGCHIRTVSLKQSTEGVAQCVTAQMFGDLCSYRYGANVFLHRTVRPEGLSAVHIR